MITRIFVLVILAMSAVAGCKKSNTDLRNTSLDEEIIAPKAGGGSKGGGLVDADGNVYDTVRIGTQTWIAQNFKSSKLNDSTPMLQLSTQSPDGVIHTPLSLSTDPAFGYWGDKASYNRLYGKGYNIAAVTHPKFAPPGWHVPTVDDLKILRKFLSPNWDINNIFRSVNDDSSAIKLRANKGWSGCSSSLDSYGFKALPGGSFSKLGSNYFGEYADFWLFPISTPQLFFDFWYCAGYFDFYEDTPGDYNVAHVRLIKD